MSRIFRTDPTACSSSGTAVALHPDDDAHRAGITHAVVVIPDGWGSRLIARMWAAGISIPDSTAIYRAFDACTLEERLRRAEADHARGPELLRRLGVEMASADPGETAAGVVPDPMIRLPRDHRLTPGCMDEIEKDRRGMLQWSPYLHLNTPSLDGDVVWARDVGAANRLLRSMYPDRTLYRYSWSRTAGRADFTRLDADD